MGVSVTRKMMMPHQGTIRVDTASLTMMPVGHACPHCGRTDRLGAVEGGVLCGRCGIGTHYSLMEPSVAEVWRNIWIYEQRRAMADRLETKS